MTRKALVIQESNSPCFDSKSFLANRNLVAEPHNTGDSALAAFKTGRYKYVFVSMAMEHEDPLEIIKGLRNTEQELGLPPTQIVVSAATRQPTLSDMKKYNICGMIRSHRMI
jgi:CheY-like chemotaxis protein